MITEKKLTGFPSIDKPWMKYYSEDYMNDIAINYYGNKINYHTLFKEAKNCAKSLKKIGIERGDCVTLCTAGVPEAIYLILACSRIGAIANFINPMFTKEQMIDRINETNAEWIFVLDEMHSYIEDVLSDTCIHNVVIIPAVNSAPVIASKLLYMKSNARKILKNRTNGTLKYHSWKEFKDFCVKYNENIDSGYEPDTPVIMVYSSGSTGASKGILLTNYKINATVANYQNSGFNIVRGDSFLQMIPEYYKIRNSMPVHSNGKRDVEVLRRYLDGLIKVN